MNLTEELIRKTLNASSITCGSKPLNTTAALLATSATAYTGGIVLTNASATAAEIIWICTTGTATPAGVTCYPLLAGASIPIAAGDLHAISAIAASGTPTIGWIGSTL